MHEYRIEKFAERLGMAALCIFVLAAAAGLLANLFMAALQIAELMSVRMTASLIDH